MSDGRDRTMVLLCELTVLCAVLQWYSPVTVASASGHVEWAWQIYEHSGDLAFLSKAYDFYHRLWPTGVPLCCGAPGQIAEAAAAMERMATALHRPASEAMRWAREATASVLTLEGDWEACFPHFMGCDQAKDVSALQAMLYRGMNRSWAAEFTDSWAMDGVQARKTKTHPLLDIRSTIYKIDLEIGPKGADLTGSDAGLL